MEEDGPARKDLASEARLGASPVETRNAGRTLTDGSSGQAHGAEGSSPAVHCAAVPP